MADFECTFGAVKHWRQECIDNANWIYYANKAESVGDAVREILHSSSRDIEDNKIWQQTHEFLERKKEKHKTQITNSLAKDEEDFNDIKSLKDSMQSLDNYILSLRGKTEIVKLENDYYIRFIESAKE